jgi:hypothetical protein
MFLRFFRLSILAFEVGKRPIQGFLIEPDSDRSLRMATPLNFRIPEYSGTSKLELQLLLLFDNR